MNSMRLTILLAVLWATGSLLLAAESTPPDAPAQPRESGQDPGATQEAAVPPTAEQPAATTTENTTEDEKEAESVPPSPPASAADRKASPQRFVPSEQVRADFDVSFPIDI